MKNFIIEFEDFQAKTEDPIILKLPFISCMVCCIAPMSKRARTHYPPPPAITYTDTDTDTDPDADTDTDTKSLVQSTPWPFSRQ